MFSFTSFMHFILITSLLLASSNGVDSRYSTCSSALLSCGNVYSNIGYPFWGDGRPMQCGHPDLQLQCLTSEKDYHSVLKMGQDDEAPYLVLSIKPYHHNITLNLRGFQNASCNSYKKGFSEVFKISPSVENITLLYNCPGSIDLPSRNLHGSTPCFTGSALTDAYYLKNTTARNVYESCSSFQVPVFRKQLDLYNKGIIGQLADVLNYGFEVIYEYSSECLKCTNSSGICGSPLHDLHSECFYEDKGIRRFEPVIPAMIIVGSGSFVIGIGMVIGFLRCLRKRRTIRTFAALWKSEAANCPNVDAFLQIYSSFSLTRYSHANIKKMTDGFNDKLGEGGYAIVYKGKLLSGRLVAVKVLKQPKGDGEDFLNEVASISRTNHVNIVSLLGFCFEVNKRALIYEFMPNGSLEKFTYLGASNQSLPWETVFNIAIGIAKGLDYLHRGCNARILHFDIKPHNILLDENFCPKISDFGLARLCPLQESTISMLEARGTIGYIAPEVFCRTFGGVSHKSDVYSFGMMVLDMVCGRKNLSADLQRSSELYFPQWIYDRLEHQTDAEFQGTINGEEKAVQRKMILVSLWCIQTYPSNRPSMSKVVDMLQGCLESIEMPPKLNLSSPPRLALDTLRTLVVLR